MNPHAPRKTLADYMVIAISPVLIMLLVGSLSFFLIQVFYRGDLAGNVRWVVFWFVLAVVLVARIGIEQGSGSAMVYGLALAAATWLYLMWLHPAYVLGILLLGLVWWCADKLTRDCTLIDEDEDVSGNGLLQAARPGSKTATGTDEPPDAAGKKPAGGSASAREQKRRVPPPHPPGLWVVYFSLAALPLFGVGQMLLRGGDTAARRAGLTLLFVYLAAALGLLLTTSFLGLRRYLRQRHLVMPGTIAFGWIRFGLGVAVAVLVAALLLPRPGVDAAWSGLRYQVEYHLRRASEYAARMGGHGQGEGRPGQDAGASNNQGAQGAAGQTGDSKGQVAEDQRATSTNPDESAPNQGPSRNQPLPVSSDRAGRFYVLFRDLLLLAAALLAGWWLLRRRHLILQMIRSFVAALMDFIRSLFQFRFELKRGGDTGGKQARAKRPAFAAYENPFVTGRDRSWPPEQLILYSYEAVRTWAEEHGVKPQPQQTAREFCVELGEKFPEVDSELSRLSFLYAHAAYGASLPVPCDLELVRQLWRYLTATQFPA